MAEVSLDDLDDERLQFILADLLPGQEALHQSILEGVYSNQNHIRGAQPGGPYGYSHRNTMQRAALMLLPGIQPRMSRSPRTLSTPRSCSRRWRTEDLGVEDDDDTLPDSEVSSLPDSEEEHGHRDKEEEGVFFSLSNTHECAYHYIRRRSKSSIRKSAKAGSKNSTNRATSCTQKSQADRQDGNGDDVDLDNMTYEQRQALVESVGSEDRGLSDELISYLEPWKYKAVKESGFFSRNINREDCPICLSTFRSRETMITLPCRHHYHAACVTIWLKVKKACPVCKYELSGPC